MANKLYEESCIQDIANAIREKNNTINVYCVSEMGDAIRNIPTNNNGTSPSNPDDIKLIEKGQCGENIEYRLYESGRLELIGEGDTFSYSKENKSPFYNSQYINEVIINEYITSVGAYLFEFCPFLEKIFFPSTLERIEQNAFNGSPHLNTIIYYGTRYMWETNIQNDTDLSWLSLCEVNYNDIMNIDYDSCGGTVDFDLYADGRIILYGYGGSNCETYSYTADNYTTENPIYKHKDYIQTVIINNDIAKIGSYLFHSCDNIKKIIIPASVKVIEENAFYAWNVGGDKQVIYLGTKEQWDEITIGAGNLIIDTATLICQYDDSISGEFEGIALVDSGVLGDVEWSLYENGSFIVEGAGEAFLENIEGTDHPFNSIKFCTQINYVIIKEGVTKIRDNTMPENPHGYSAVKIPSTMLSIGENNFRYIPYNRPDSIRSCVYYPGTKQDWDKIEINLETNDLFLNYPLICEYEEPPIAGEFEGVALLEEGAFDGGKAFYHIYDNGWAIIDGVGQVEYNTGLELINPSPFYGNDSITHAYIADGITGIGESIFEDCGTIQEIRLPDSLQLISRWAFYGTMISKIYIPSNVNIIDEEAFGGCTMLTDVYYAGTKSEWDAIFSQWDLMMGGLRNITLHCKYEVPEFNGVALLESGKCGENINYNTYDNGWVVLEGAGDTYDYEEVYDDESGEFLGYNSPFLNNAFITHVYIADDITMVGRGLFLNCTNIEEVRLPDGLRSIGVSAFENTGISKIYLPNSIMGVELDAFYGCLNLTDVYYNGTKDDWHSFWDGSDFGADVAIFDAGLADATLHCEYEEPITETWTFEMEDGSIVTKEVVVV